MLLVKLSYFTILFTPKCHDERQEFSANIVILSRWIFLKSLSTIGTYHFIRSIHVSNPKSLSLQMCSAKQSSFLK